MRSVLLTVPRPPFFFFFNDTATTEIYTLSLHDALPISDQRHAARDVVESAAADASRLGRLGRNHPQADDVHGDGERAVTAGPGRGWPLQRDIEGPLLTSPPEADAPTRRFPDEIHPPPARRGGASPPPH